MRTKHAVERYVDVVSMIRKAPRTTRELCELAQLSPSALRRLTRAMEGEGLIRNDHTHELKRAKNAIVWVWQA